MKSLFPLSALAGCALAMTNGCSPDQTNVIDESGNAYCEPAVTTIKYTGIGGSGQYKTVVNIDSAGTCDWASRTYSGPLAPYDEEIGLAFRGPLKLRQFAAYSADVHAPRLERRLRERGSEAKKGQRATRPSPHERRHGYAHRNFHRRQKERRGVGDWVTAVIDGELVSWINTYAGPTAAADPDAGTYFDESLVVSEAVGSAAEPTLISSTIDAAAARPTLSSASSSSSENVGGSWARISYYNAEERINQGSTFLAHPPWRNELAFAGVSSTEQASESTCFGGELDNGDEMIIMTDAPCSEDIGTECAYFKQGDEAFHGFGGTKKAFFFEFQMPDSGTNCSVGEMESKYVADNMPAIWTLNAKILTDQYGCNCQSTGCGEVDLFEILNPGNKRMKSTFHGNAGFSGGDSHYTERPFDKYMSAIAIFDENSLIIQVLDDGTEAPASLTQQQIDEWVGRGSEEDSNIAGKLAVFAMSPV